METKVLQVYYGTDALPYKDSAREVHFPVVGIAFTGASNTTQIRFYVKDIGGTSATTWVAVTKLPSGKKLYKQLSVGTDTGEPYVYLDLTTAYTLEKGDIYIALNGYASGVNIAVNSDTGLYTITGSPVIQATGNIKISLAYTPYMDTNYGEVDTISVQEALAYVSEKLNITSGIIVVADLADENASSYTEGQYLYSKAEYNFWHFYKVSSGNFVKITDKGLSDNNLTDALLSKLNGIESGAQVNVIETIKVNGNALPVSDKAVNIDISGKLDKKTTSGTYAYTHTGSSQGEIGVSENATGSTIPLRDSNGQLYVPQDPTNDLHATSKKYVLDKISEFMQNEIYLVDIDEYPSLDYFLATFQAQEGIIYLYPIDTTESPDFESGYYRYTWENNAWLSLGTTQVDLSNYYTKDDTNTLLNNKANIVGKLPSFNVSAIDSISTFLTTNSVAGLPIILNITNVGSFIARITYDSELGYTYQLISTIDNYYFSASDDTGVSYFGDLITTSKRHIIEFTENKTTTLNASSTDTQYPSAKAVYDNLVDIREVAEGKCKTVVVNTTTPAPTSDLSASAYKKPDGTSFTGLSDFNTYVSGLTFSNSDFASQDSSVIITSGFYLISNDNIVYTNSYINGNFKLGDIILIQQENYPDRWISNIGTTPIVFSKLETALANYYAKNVSLTPTTTATYDLGSSTYKFQNLYLSGAINLGSSAMIWSGNSGVLTNTNFVPSSSYNLGNSSLKWNDIWGTALKGFSTLTQAQYDTLVSGGTVDSDTFYFIEEE